MGGWGELYLSLFWIFGISLTLQSPFTDEYIVNTPAELPHCAVLVCVGTHTAGSLSGLRLTTAVLLLEDRKPSVIASSHKHI